MTRETPLHAVHQSLGASFTDFAGYQMPVRYSSELAEHHAVREVRRLKGVVDYRDAFGRSRERCSLIAICRGEQLVSDAVREATEVAVRLLGFGDVLGIHAPECLPNERRH